MKLREREVGALTLPPGKTDKIFFDDDVPGFAVRLRAGGSGHWIFQYRVGNKQRRMTFGSVSAMSVGRARAQAEKLHAAVKLGGDPATKKEEAKRLTNETVGAKLPDFLAAQQKRLRPRSFVEIERHLEVHAKALHGLPLVNVTRRDVASVLTKLAASKSNGTVNRVRSSLSAFFTWSIRQGFIDNHPVAFTEMREEKSRERILTDGELFSIWAASRDDAYGAITKLLLHTGARREEIGGLFWREIDFDKAVIELPAERTKNKRPHVIPLSDAALAILQKQPRLTMPDGSECVRVFGRGERGFADWRGSKVDLDQRIAVAREANGQTPMVAWVMHDFRRALSTTMHDRLGIAPNVVEAILNHVGHRAGTAGIYNRAGYANPKRIALEKWAAHLEAVVSGKREAAVVKLRA